MDAVYCVDKSLKLRGRLSVAGLVLVDAEVVDRLIRPKLLGSSLKCGGDFWMQTAKPPVPVFTTYQTPQRPLFDLKITRLGVCDLSVT
jgi:hypothetical protein